MPLKDGTLKVLDRVGVTVQLADLRQFLRQRVALLGQPSLRLPVLPEKAADRVAGFGEIARRVAGLAGSRCAEQGTKEHQADQQCAPAAKDGNHRECRSPDSNLSLADLMITTLGIYGKGYGPGRSR